MSTVGQIERKTQNRVVRLFREQLGYTYGGNRADQDNSNIDEARLRASLASRGYDEEIRNRAVSQLLTAASLGVGQKLYDGNRRFYELLRYGVKVKRDVGEVTETVWPIDWTNPLANDFVVAEEVTIKGEQTKRPDIVLYVNGIALGVVELKRSFVSVSEGIRQNIGNQNQHFVRPFFTTVQLLFAGNDVEGLRYDVIETPEKYWLEWKEPVDEPNPLDRSLIQMCSKGRLLELIHDFIVFDAGVKKTAVTTVLRRQGRPRAGCRPGGRHHLAYPGLREEPHDGVAGQVDSRAPGRRQSADHHRPNRTRRTDREGLRRSQREDLPHNLGRGPHRPAQSDPPLAHLLAHA